MSLVTDLTIPRYLKSSQAFNQVYEQYVDEASFLWLLRSYAVDQPNYDLTRILQLENNIEAQLDALMGSIEQGWQACFDALRLEEPGEVFTTMVTALRSHEVDKIQIAVDAGFANEHTFKAMVSAFAWVPHNLVEYWIERFLSGKEMQQKYLGVAICSARRHDPGEALTVILQREDCLQDYRLRARALRLVGELRRQDLMPALLSAMQVSDINVRFWAIRSAILLGYKSMAENLKNMVLETGPYRNLAMQVAFRVLSVDTAREWIASMMEDSEQMRSVIKATAILGDPHAVNWLISQMKDPLYTRLAGEAFSMITGMDLKQEQLNQNGPVNKAVVTHDISTNIDIAMDEDRFLPWPDADKIAAAWRQRGQKFIIGQRYFLGHTIDASWLKQQLQIANQRQRHAAALELALIDSETPLLNTRSRAYIVS